MRQQHMNLLQCSYIWLGFCVSFLFINKNACFCPNSTTHHLSTNKEGNTGAANAVHGTPSARGKPDKAIHVAAKRRMLLKWKTLKEHALNS